MKITIPLFLMAGVLLIVGCRQNSDNSAAPSDTVNTNSLENEVKTNVVAPITNAYMSTTNAIIGTNH
jgi:hypothetical protein